MYYLLAVEETKSEMMARGAEVVGNQYKHRLISSVTDVYEEKDLELFAVGTLAGIAQKITKKFPVSWSVALEIAGFVYEIAQLNTNYSKLKIVCNMYEVLRSYDNSYYTHCYHCMYDAYDSQGHLYAYGVDYYQAIGG